MSRISLRFSAALVAGGLALSGCSAVEEAVGDAVSSVAADSAGAALDLLLQPVCATLMVPLNAYEELAAAAAQNQEVQQLKDLINEYLSPITAAATTARSAMESIDSSKSAQLLRDLGVVEHASLSAQALSSSTDAQAVIAADNDLRSSIDALRTTCSTL